VLGKLANEANAIPVVAVVVIHVRFVLVEVHVPSVVVVVSRRRPVVAVVSNVVDVRTVAVTRSRQEHCA